ncbi:MAG: XdhC family protein, partial [Pseudomonadota bacterium]
MYAPSSSRIPEHALDVLRLTLAQQEAGLPCALAIMTSIEGGGVRAPGALMGVTAEGHTFGYLSGGCIDADVALRAQSALKTGTGRSLRYGAGSPFVDIQLPCGGAIEIAVCPDLSTDTLKTAIAHLEARQSIYVGIDRAYQLSIHEDKPSTEQLDLLFVANYRPQLQLRVVGSGAETIALARLAKAVGVGCIVQSHDETTLKAVEALGAFEGIKINGLNDLPDIEDDPSTAVVILYHDAAREGPLLKQALNGNAFYIGAVGSRNTS